MAIARFKDICVDAVDAGVLGRFWAAAAGLRWVPDGHGEGKLTGATPGHTIWVNRVPEERTVKQRVHLDLYSRTLEELEKLGARRLEDFPRWTIMADPEGGEFCAFLREEPPADRIHGLVVDSADPRAQAEWWREVYGAGIDHNGDEGWSTVENVPGMPFLTMDFVPVPEPKTVKNRIHWDVTGEVGDLVAAGATVLRPRDETIRWTVMADPEGNEFCVFDA
ncbi:VOC family protein [Actinocorallia longicatena]|uniref:VOC family protein n=1 Tax=Actinocorallia longicatena TaxID=111803 RepID=A0ABP6QMZ4_9ACTN